VQNFVAAPAPVFRKDTWLACGGLDEALWYDWDIWPKLAASGPVYYHDNVTTGFRIHGGSLTVAGSRDVADFAHQMLISLNRHLPRFWGGSKSVERAGRASIAVNTALAAPSAGDLRGLLPAVSKILQLGPQASPAISATPGSWTGWRRACGRNWEVRSEYGHGTSHPSHVRSL
jgi:hypothetical protein